MQKARVRMLNRYRLVFKPDHPSAMKSENWEGYVYEHIFLIESQMGRLMADDEVVHHLDGNRENNRLENLLLILKSQHGKLHSWIDAGAPFEKSNGEQGINSGKSKVSYCKVCDLTLQAKQKYFCSEDCRGLAARKITRPTKEELSLLLDNNSREAVGRIFGVSGNAVKKWQAKYNLL